MEAIFRQSIGASDSLANSISTSSTSAVEIIPAQSGKRIVIRDLMVTNANTDNGVLVRILSGNTVVWQGWACAEGGWSHPFAKGRACGTGKAVKVSLGGNIGPVYVNVNAYAE